MASVCCQMSQGHLRVTLGPPQGSQGLGLWQLRVLLLLSAPSQAGKGERLGVCD